MTAHPVTEDDNIALASWARHHGVRLPPTMPAVGFVVGDGAYVGLEVVGERAWLELALTCPGASRSHAYASLAACVHACEHWAREHGVRTLFAFTDHPAMGAWIAKQGYREHRGYLTSKEM